MEKRDIRLLTSGRLDQMRCFTPISLQTSATFLPCVTSVSSDNDSQSAVMSAVQFPYR